MEPYQLERPSDRIFLCTHSDCNEVADYLELTEEGGEEVFCAGHNEPSQSRAIDAEIKFATLRAGFRSCSTRLVRNEFETL